MEDNISIISIQEGQVCQGGITLNRMGNDKSREIIDYGKSGNVSKLSLQKENENNSNKVTVPGKITANRSGNSISISTASLHHEERNEDISTREHCPNQNLVSYWNGFLIVGILVGCSAMLSTILLIPRSNSIIYPGYWMELNVPVAFVILASTISSVLEFKVLLKLKTRDAVRVGIKLYLWTFIPWITFYCLC